MSIQAVIFDYGMVLCSQDPDRHADLIRITGLDRPTFESHYWHDRHSYDLGLFDGLGFWQRFAQRTGLALSPEQFQALVENDTLMWSRLNRPMLAWVAALQRAGLRTAILSNMVSDLLRHMRTSPDFDWLAGFTHLTWSCDLGIGKPDPAIYLHTCEKLQVRPEHSLFIDDKPENIAAAEALGIRSILFTDAAQLRRDLHSRNLLQDFPQPGESAPVPGEEPTLSR
jgi:putative hydrolase of the HAD superfamily